MRATLTCAALALFGWVGSPAWAQTDNSDIDGLYWIDEKPSSFDQAIEKIPLVGLIVRQTRPDAQLLLVRMIDGRLAVQIPDKDIVFPDVRRQGSTLTARMPNPDNRQEMLSLRLVINGPTIAGDLVYGATRVTWQGRLIQEHERDRRRLAELAAAARPVSEAPSPRDDALQELEWLRARVDELEQARDRAENEIRSLRTQPSRGPEPAPPKPAPVAAPKPTPVAAVTPAAAAVAKDRYLVLKSPASESSPQGLAIVVPAPGFVSVVGEVRGLPLPLRGLSLNGQAMELQGGNRFDGTVRIEGEAQQLVFNVVDSAGQTHSLTYGVRIRTRQ